jgi:Arc/MetJ-type ribon-helix-helix transcriptional regulator
VICGNDLKGEEAVKKEEKNKAVFLSAELYDQIEQKVKATNFGSVEEYVTFVLEEVIKEEEEEETVFTEDEEKEIKKRLKDLGYLE